MFFVDEVGDNTSQKNDGNVAGEKFIMAAEQCTLIQSSFKDCHFTVLGFTSTMGEPVCYIIILAAKTVEAKNKMGIQPWVTPTGNPAINLEENSFGEDKYFPHGPVCEFQGKRVET